MAAINSPKSYYYDKIKEEARARGVSPSFPVVPVLKTEKDFAADKFVVAKMNNNMADAVECMECGLIWCEHVKELIRNGYDTVEHLWEPPETRGEPSILYVPMFPDLHDLCWAEVMLLPFDNVTGEPYPGGISAINLFYPQETTNNVSKWRDGIGFWCPGEGRLSLRSSINSWLQSHDIFNPRNCPSGAHNYRAAQVVEKAFREGDEAYIMACRFLIATLGGCVVCSEFADFSTDAPEL